MTTDKDQQQDLAQARSLADLRCQDETLAE